jgi:hypothetical protein
MQGGAFKAGTTFQANIPWYGKVPEGCYAQPVSVHDYIMSGNNGEQVHTVERPDCHHMMQIEVTVNAGKIWRAEDRTKEKPDYIDAQLELPCLECEKEKENAEDTETL